MSENVFSTPSWWKLSGILDATRTVTAASAGPVRKFLNSRITPPSWIPISSNADWNSQKKRLPTSGLSEKCAVLHLYRYISYRLVSLLWEIFIITGQLLEEVVISVIHFCRKTVTDRLYFHEVWYSQFLLCFHCVLSRLVANCNITPCRKSGAWSSDMPPYGFLLYCSSEMSFGGWSLDDADTASVV